MAQEADMGDLEEQAVAHMRTYRGKMLLRYRQAVNRSKENEVQLEVSATIAIDETGAPVRAYAEVYDLGIRFEADIDPVYRSIRHKLSFNGQPSMLLIGNVLVFEGSLEFGFKLVAEDQEPAGKTRMGRVVGHGSVTMTEDISDDPTEEEEVA